MNPLFYSALSPGAVSLSPSDFAGAASLAAAGGFAGLEIPVTSLGAETDDASIRRILESNRLRPAGWGLPVEWRRDEAVWKEGLKNLPAWAKRAAALGSDRCSTWVLSFSDECAFDENLAFHVERLNPIAAILADHGCRFGLEYLGPRTIREGHRHAFIHTAEEMLRLCRLVGPLTGLLLDSWHWFTAGETIDSILKLSASDVVYVHVNDAPEGIPLDQQIDNRRCLPGATGVIPIGSFLEALVRIGYDGPVVPEPFDANLATMADDRARVAAAGDSMRAIWKVAGF
ncbi:MAG: sugar phosphate isomerase/epimerase family protein [Opitutaceae bacterium]